MICAMKVAGIGIMSGLLWGFSTLLSAADIQDNAVVEMRVSSVDIFEVLAVDVIKQEKVVITNAARIKAIAQVKLMVQGNVCAADPASLSLLSTSVPEEKLEDVSLFVMSKYQYDPWGRVNICKTYARNTTIVLPIKIEGVVLVADNSTKLKKIRIKYADPLTGAAGTKIVTFTSDAKMQVVVTIQDG